MRSFAVVAALLAASVISQQRNKGGGLMASGAYGMVGPPMTLGARLLSCAMFC